MSQDINMESVNGDTNGNGPEEVDFSEDVKLPDNNIIEAASAVEPAMKEEPEEPAAVVDTSKWDDNEKFQALIGANKVEPGPAVGIMELFADGLMTEEDFDERAMQLFGGFNGQEGAYLVEQLRKASFTGVQNKASFLMAVMRNFRDRIRTMGSAAAIQQPLITGPDAENLKSILDRTGYTLEVTMGQRKYGGPPPGEEGAAPTGQGHEIYVGHIPKEMFEDSLIPLFEECGRIWDMRLMMDALTGQNRGYAFVTFCEPAAAKRAEEKYNDFEIKPGRKLKVNVSVANTRLFLGNIPKSKSKEEILTELKTLTDGVADVIVYTTPEATENRRNRGFCFVDFEDHKSASDAKRRLSNGKIRPWNCDLVVDWAEAQDEPDTETMSKVKVLYVRNLKEVVTEDELREVFAPHGEIERVKKIRDYAFVHFAERENALKAMEAMNGQEIQGLACNITLAKPQMDRQKRDRLKMERERRQMMMMGRGAGFSPGRGMRGGGYGAPPGMGFRGRGAFRGGYDYGYGGGYDDFYGQPGGGGYDYYGPAGGADYYGYGAPAAPSYDYTDYYGYSSGYGAPPARGGRGGYGTSRGWGRGGGMGRGTSGGPARARGVFKRKTEGGTPNMAGKRANMGADSWAAASSMGGGPAQDWTADVDSF